MMVDTGSTAVRKRTARWHRDADAASGTPGFGQKVAWVGGVGGRSLLAVCLALSLAACGGGGSGGATATPGSALRAPTADFTVTTAVPVAGVAVNFDGRNSRDSDGQVDRFEWNFGDGRSASGATTSHLYAGAGTYNVTLTVTDNQGLSASVQRAFVVGGNFAPVAAFTINAASGQVPHAVTFDAAPSSDQDGTLVSYIWDFGDGTGAGGITAQHTYNAPGTYQANLQVTDNSGAVATRSEAITVNAAVGNFDASGVISILSTSAIDVDVNDLNTILGNNDSLATAQRVSNPVTVGGYINEPGSGPNGRLRTSGDPADSFAIALAGGETITLTIGDPDPALNDLDLILYDATGRELVRSEGVDTTERVTAPTPGNYFVQVIPFSGASTYVLTVGRFGSDSATAEFTTAEDFVPGELIVEYAAGAAGAKGEARMAALGLRRVQGAGSARGPQLLRFAPAATLATMGVQSQLQARADADPHAATVLAAKLLAREAGVASVDLNYLRRANATPNDSLYRVQWHLRDIGLPQAWDITTGSRNVVVAVIDTGVRPEHPDLAENLIAGYDFITDTARARDGNGPDADPTDPGDLSVGSSSSFHGTHVAGTVGAIGNNGIGVAGVAWNVSIMPLRVLGKGGGTSFDLIQSIRYAARLSNNTGALPARRADIINMSLGGGAFSQSEQNAITAARDAGVIIVAAAGNDGVSALAYPASYSGVNSVSATTISRTRAAYSNFGTAIDVAAPGGNNGTDINGDGVGDGVVSTIGDDTTDTLRLGYTALNGTSMASPHVAGVIALMKSVLPTMTPALLDAELSSGRLTDDAGARGRDDQFGHGIVNANKAVARARALFDQVSGGSVSILLASPSSLAFGSQLTQQNADLQNAGDGALSITSVRTNQPWLSAVAGAIDANGLGPYVVRVSRAGLAEGSYTGQVTFVSTTNEVVLTVSMEVRSVAVGSSAGLHYVLLIDPQTRRTVRSAMLEASNAQYSFSLLDVPAGSYEIVAGSDSNNDGFICDAGEACGVYRDIELPETVILSSDRADLNFSSGFRSTIDARSLSVQPGGRAKSAAGR